MGSKAYGIPYSAATVLVVDASTPTPSISLQGTTGMTPFLSNNLNAESNGFIAQRYGGRGYLGVGSDGVDRTPKLTVTSPPAGGTQMVLAAQVAITSHLASVATIQNTNMIPAAANPSNKPNLNGVTSNGSYMGTGYTSSPTAAMDAGVGAFNETPTFYNPSPYTTSFRPTPTMIRVDPPNPNPKGYQPYYRVTGVNVKYGGDGFIGRRPIQFIGGKGAPAKAQAVILKGQVDSINIIDDVPGSGLGSGSGYTSNPRVVLTGGGAKVNATAELDWSTKVDLSNRTPIEYEMSTTGELKIKTGNNNNNVGALKGYLRITNRGSGYKSAPSVSFVGGKGDPDFFPDDAFLTKLAPYTTAQITSADTVILPNGKVTKIEVTNGGLGYVLGSITVTIQKPDQAGGNPGTGLGGLGSVQAIARVSAVNSTTGTITEITLDYCGSGYLESTPESRLNPPPVVTISAPTHLTLPRLQATATATVRLDGRIADVEITTQGVGYVDRPTVSWEVIPGRTNKGRLSEDGGTAVTPGTESLNGNIFVFLEGQSGGTTDKSPYATNTSSNNPRGMSNGTGKFVAPFVVGTTIYCLPSSTHRMLKISLTAPTLQLSDTVLLEGTSYSRDFGTAKDQYTAVVGNAENPKTYYGIPGTGRVEILKFTSSISGTSQASFVVGPSITKGGVTTSGKNLSFNGGYNAGVLAFNGCIYCVPKIPTNILVIDTKQDTKTEAIAFVNQGISGSIASKWSDIVAAGDTSAKGILYGVPADLNTVLEINPGAALRRLSLPATGCVLNDKKSIVFTPTLTSPQTSTVFVYNTVTATMESIVASGAENVSYVEGVELSNGSVVFVPGYNQTDAFTYAGNVGLFNPTANPKTFTLRKGIELEKVPPYPSRTACVLGPTVGVGTERGNLVTWVPRSGNTAVVVYDSSADTTSFPVTRVETSVSFVTAQRVKADGSQVVVTLPNPSTATYTSTSDIPVLVNVDATPTNETRYTRAKFSGAVLVKMVNSNKDAVVLIPGGAYVNDFTLYYPDVKAAKGTTDFTDPTKPYVTLIKPSSTLLEDFKKVGSNGLKFVGGVLGTDGNVYCIPHDFASLVVLNPQDLTVQQIGKPVYDGTSDQPSLYWGGVLAGNGKIYCCPYNAGKIMVIDPSIDNSEDRIEYIPLPTGYINGTQKWRGCCVTKTGKIYCAPFDAKGVLIIDPSKDLATVEFTEVDNTWITGTEGERYSGCVSGGDGKVYMVPFNAPDIVAIDPVTKSWTATSTRVNAQNKWIGGIMGQNGKLYLIPHAYLQPLEFDPVSRAVKFLSAPVNTNVNRGSEFGAAVILKSGKIVAFPSYQIVILEIEVDGQYVAVYDHTATAGPTWQKCGRIPYQYRLRPFALKDKTSVMFHTGNANYAIFNSKLAGVNTVPLIGPKVADGVAAFSQDDKGNELVRSFAGNVVTEIAPSIGGIAGVKSYTKKADLFMMVNGYSSEIGIGNGNVVQGGVFENVYPGGNLSILSAYLGSPSASTPPSLNFYLGETYLSAAKDKKFDPNPGTPFTVGRVQGAEFEAVPGSTAGFAGTISELVVFTSNQQARATSLANNTTFFFDSQMPR